MKSGRWEKIEELYHAALELEASQRVGFLDQACAGDETLRREIESLLAYKSRAENFIESPAIELAATLLAKDQARLHAGHEMGAYRVLSLIGSGGMGEVYQADDVRLRRKVALKLLPAEFTQDPARARRFEQEARAASALNHPNILTIYDIGQIEGTHYIATEFIEGQTLRHHLARGHFPVREALDVACQIASALSAAHEAGIVHRDIKPENIMLRPDGIVKLLDFGLAKLIERRVSTALPATMNLSTKPGIVMGTVRYMSPEQLRAQKIDARSDLFSLGVVLYEMAAGCAPFRGDSSADVIAAIINQEPPPLAGFTPKTPEALERIITKSLYKNRDDRYQTAKDLLDDLKSLKRKLEFEEELLCSMGSNQPRATAQPRTAQTRKRPSRKAITSLAILPLVNTSDDPAMEYLSDGITESIINTLSQLPKLRVVARSTVFRYKGQEVDPQEIGRGLGVQAVLTGRVRQVEDRLAIAVELIDVASDSQLWGEHYSRDLSEIFEVQEEIAKEITENLRLKLNRKEKGRITKRYTESTTAYQLYLKGRYHRHKFTVESLQKAIDCFLQAIDLEPGYALAYAGLADTYSALSAWEVVILPPREGMPKAKAAAMKALEIDDALGEAHASLAFVRMYYDWDWLGADREFERAIKLNPSYANAHHWYSHFLMVKGQVEESLAMSKRALELDPLDIEINVHMAWHYYYAGEYDQAIEECRKTIDLEPNFFYAYYFLGWAYERQGKYQEAIAEFQKAITPPGHRSSIKASLAHTYALSGQKDEARRILDELLELSKQQYLSPYDIAIIYTGLGEKERALQWLERAYEDRSGWLVYLHIEPRFDHLRSDERFQDLLRRMGLAPSETSLNHKPGIETGQSISQAMFRGIAVLPFKPINARQRDEYLELGIADALITKLTNIGQIDVRPTSAVRKYTKLDQDPRAAGRELRVESVLEGSIQKLADRIRVTAQLVRVNDGRSLWAGQFDENFTDIFAVEDSISERVAAVLALKLTGEEKKRLTKHYTENVEAYEAYLKGRFFWNKRTTHWLKKSVNYFQQAIGLDPTYALAYAGLADSYTLLVTWEALTPEDGFSKAKAAARSALEIDASLGEAHAGLAHTLLHTWDWAESESEFKRGIDLNPGYAPAHQWYAEYLAAVGRFDESVAEIKRARELEPLSVNTYHDVGRMLYFARRYDEAIEQQKQAIEMEPGFWSPHHLLGQAYTQKAMYEEAIQEFQRAMDLSGKGALSVVLIGHAYAASGKRDKALEVVDRLKELSKERYFSPYRVAMIYAGLGDKDQMFEWLERAYQKRDANLIWLKVDPVLDGLRYDSRFANLLRRVGLAP